MPFNDLVLLILAWGLYGGLHSLLISTAVVSHFQRWLGRGYRYYRLGFNAISVATLVPVVWLAEVGVMQGRVWWDWSGPWRVAQWGIAIAGSLLFAAGARHYDMKQFLGAPSRWTSGACSAMGEDCQFAADGILAWIRHPWYTGAMVIIWARPIDTAALVSNLSITVYLIVGTWLEERKLVRFFGTAYRDYQKKTPMFLPRRRSD